MAIEPPSSSAMAARRMRGLALTGSVLATPAAVVRHLLAVQAQEHPVARWSVAQRMERAAPASEIDDAFDRGDFVRTHVLRPTWHYVSPDDLRWLMRFSGPRIRAKFARYWEQFGLGAAELKTSTDSIAEAVRDGPCTRPELGDRLSRSGTVVAGPELAARVMHAELHMAVCSGPMRGRQHTYMAFDQRVAGGDGPVGDEALMLLARRYFATRGPATAHDLAWWAGLSVTEARRGMELASADLEFHEDGGRRYAFAGDPVPKTQRSFHLVQCYDEAVVSYRTSRDVLKTPQVSFDPLTRTEGFVHLVLRDGRLHGRWRFVKTAGAVEVRLYDAVSPADEKLLSARVEALRRFLAA